MAEKEFNTRIVHKHDIQANWEKAVGFIPKQGELIVYDVDENYDYQRIKIGDGVKNVNVLPFYNDGFVTEEDAPNLYVWKKYTGDPSGYSLGEKGSLSVGTTLYGVTSVSYANEIKIVDGKLSLGDTVAVSGSTANDFNILKGKYVLKIYIVSSEESYVKYYYIEPDAIIRYNNGVGISSVREVILNSSTTLGYVASKSFSTYPSSGEHTDGYWYEYYRQLGDAAVVDDSNINFTEADPTVPAWAKAATKPTYTASEVGALPDTTAIPSKTSDLTNDSGYITSAPVTSVNGMTGDVTIEIETDTVKYVEQTLTDEQKTQARENVSAFGYNWHEVYDGEYYANIPGYEAIADWDMALAQVDSDNVPYLFKLLGSVKNLLRGDVKNTNKNKSFENFLNAITPLLEANIFVVPLRLAYKRINLGIDDPTSYLYFFINYIESSNRWIINNLAKSQMVVITDGVLTSDGTLTYPDETLSISNRAADAKATGDAINAVSALVGDTAVSEQISAAISESVADWNQTDETAVDYIKNKPEIATDDEIIEMLAQIDMIPVVTDSDGSILSDENENILLW